MINQLRCGVDLVSIARAEDLLARNHDQLLREVLTEQEWQYCAQHKNPGPQLAARLAAKEALKKLFPKACALQEINCRDLEVTHDNYGAPIVVMNDTIKRLLCDENLTTISISITHTAEYALVNVIAYG